MNRRAESPRLMSVAGRAELSEFYRDALMRDVIPFWLRHGIDRDHGGVLTCLDRDGTVIDDDKSIWFQGRAAWMFAVLAKDVRHWKTTEPLGIGSPREEELVAASKGCIEFLRRHGEGPGGKLWFTVTRDGKPLRNRRYVYSESFAAIGNAAYAAVTGDDRAAEDAIRYFETFLRHSFEPGWMPPKYETTRPMKGIGPLFITIATAQELRRLLGNPIVGGKSCSAWIDDAIKEIQRDFVNDELEAVLECVAPDGSVIDHHEGRTLNPGHALECGWFILHEGELRRDRLLVDLGVKIIDWMWRRGWDEQFGGLLYFTDLYGKPVQEYWHEMKFWWPHCEAILATLMAWEATGDARFARMHDEVHDWSFRHFADPVHGEWYGYLRRDGTPSSMAKGTLWKGPFHLPRMLWQCASRLRFGPASV